MAACHKFGNTPKGFQRKRMPRHTNDTSKEALKATLEKERECNAKALQIVEQMLESPVSERWFLKNLKYINDSHFQDIVEERTIMNLCGYPLCGQKLKNIPNQKFHISTKLNKVYDITERKNFCSNQCYKAAKYVKAQLLTTPLWLRDKEETPDFTVVPVHISGCPGEEVDLGQSDVLRAEVLQLYKTDHFTQALPSKLPKEVEKHENDLQNDLGYVNAHCGDEQGSVGQNNLTLLQDKEDHSNSIDIGSSRSSKSVNAVISNTDLVTSVLSNVSLDSHSTQEKDMGSIVVQTESAKQVSTPAAEETCRNSVELKMPVSCDGAQTKDKSKTKKCGKHEASKRVIADISSTPSGISHIEKCLHEWVTVNTMCFLFGEAKVKEMVSDKGECLKEYYKAACSAAWDRTVQERYAAICRRLDMAELQDKGPVEQRRPLPGYPAVQAEGHALELKVQAFYQGKVSFGSGSTDNSEPKETDNSPVTVLPLVDLHAQNALRRRIVLDRLNRVIPDLLRTFGTSSYDIGASVRLLVCSFSLGAHNITFKPAEWSLLGLLMIKMLALKDVQIKILLDSEQAKKYLTMMLMMFQLDGSYLDRLIAWVTDVDTLLCKQQPT